MAKEATARETAEQRLRDLESEVERVSSDIAKFSQTASESTIEMNAHADCREDLLARGDTAGAEAARVAASLAAGRLNDAQARIAGLRRLLATELEPALPAAAVEVAVAWLAEMDAALAASRARLEEGAVTEQHVLQFANDYASAWSLRSALHAATKDMRFACLTYDLKPELERRGLLGISPDYIRFRHVPRPAPVTEPWSALKAHLEAFKVARESATQRANAAAHAARAAEQRAASAANPFGGVA